MNYDELRRREKTKGQSFGYITFYFYGRIFFFGLVMTPNKHIGRTQLVTADHEGKFNGPNWEVKQREFLFKNLSFSLKIYQKGRLKTAAEIKEALSCNGYHVIRSKKNRIFVFF